MKTLTIIKTVLSSILIPILFSSTFFPNESSQLQQAERVACNAAHNASNVTVEDTVLDVHFVKAIEAMRSKGYKVMASFLESQLLGSDMEEYSSRIFFIYPPSDEAVARAKVGFGELPLILLRHITTRALSRRSDGSELWRTFLPGFVVIQSWSPYLLNCEVPSRGPVLYSNSDRKLFVFGLQEILSPLTEEDILKRRGGLRKPCDL